MVFRYRLSSNLKPLLLPLAVIAVTGGSVAIAVFYNIAVGIIAILVTGYLGFHVMKFFVNTVRSQVELLGDELICLTSMGKEMRMAWESITHAGTFTDARGGQDLFVYAEQDDRLLTIPSHFERIDELAAEIEARSRVEFYALQGDEQDDLSDALREIVAPEDEIIDDEE